MWIFLIITFEHPKISVRINTQEHQYTIMEHVKCTIFFFYTLWGIYLILRRFDVTSETLQSEIVDLSTIISQKINFSLHYIVY